MFAMGLRLSFTELINSASLERRLIFRALIANFVIIPGITVWVIVLFQVSPMVAAGLVILGVSRQRLMARLLLAIARGNLAISTGLMVILAGISAFMIPLLLHFLIPMISYGDLSIKIDLAKLLGTLFFIQLLPLFLGLSIGQWRPKLAEALVKPAGHASKILNLLMISAIVVLQFKVLAGISIDAIVIMLLLVYREYNRLVFGLAGIKNRKSLSIITAMRNMSLAMGIAVTSFPDSPALTTIIAYSFVAGLAILAYAFALRQIKVNITLKFPVTRHASRVTIFVPRPASRVTIFCPASRVPCPDFLSRVPRPVSRFCPVSRFKRSPVPRNRIHWILHQRSSRC